MTKVRFAELIEELDDGQVNIEASAALRELIAKINERAQLNTKGAKGSLTLVLNIEAVNERGKLEIECSFATKHPKRPRSRDTRWADESGSLALGQQTLAGVQTTTSGGPLRRPADADGGAVR